MALSAKQRTAFAHALSDDILYIGSGAVRSGKTSGCGSAFGLFCAKHPGDHLLMGRTEAAVMRNVVRPEPYGILATLRAFGISAKPSGVDGRHVRIGANRSRIWIYGASDVGVIDRIAGSTFKAGMFDELTRLKSGEEVWQMAWTRFSTNVRKIWGTTNPGALKHWVKRLLIDKGDRYKARIVNYSMTDNPGLDAEVRRGIAAGLFGHHKRRLVDGLWVDATGLIYPTVTEGALPRYISHWSIGLDWAASGVFASVLAAHCAETFRVHLYREREYDHRERGALTDEEQAQRTADWFRESTRMHSTGVYPTVVFGDPTTPTAFQWVLSDHGLVWQDGFNDVLPGIQEVNSGFGSGQLTISPAMVKTKREANEYGWDEKAAEAGEDVPQKGRDHLLDAVRYLYASPSPIVVSRRWT